MIFKLRKHLMLFGLLSILIVFSACQERENYNLELLLETKLIPPSNTYAMSLNINGDFSCPFELHVLLDNSKYHKIILDGVVDTIVYRGDWYAGELSFNSETLQCIDKQAKAKLIWHRLQGN